MLIFLHVFMVITFNAASEKNAGLSVQTSFCAKCRKSGHTRKFDQMTHTMEKARNANTV